MENNFAIVMIVLALFFMVVVGAVNISDSGMDSNDTYIQSYYAVDGVLPTYKIKVKLMGRVDRVIFETVDIEEAQLLMLKLNKENDCGV